MKHIDQGQAELPLNGRINEAPAATIEDIERVVAVLERNGQSTAAKICMHLGWAVTENNKRKVRSVAEASRPVIVSFPNSSGYKLFKECTVDEVRSCIGAWAGGRRRCAEVEAVYLQAFHSRGWSL